MDIVVLELHEEIFVELNVGDDAVHGAVGLPCGLIAVGIVFGIKLQSLHGTPTIAYHPSALPVPVKEAVVGL